MKTLTAKIKVDKKYAKNVQKHIDENKPLSEDVSRHGEVEKTFTAHFSKGTYHEMGLEADIKIIDSTDGPWIDAVLFNHDEQVTIEPQYVLLGKYPFEYNGVKYIVHLY